MGIDSKSFLEEISKNKRELETLKKAYGKAEKQSKKLLEELEVFGKKSGSNSVHFSDFSSIISGQRQWEQDLLKRIKKADKHICFLEKEFLELSKK